MKRRFVFTGQPMLADDMDSWVQAICRVLTDRLNEVRAETGTLSAISEDDIAADLRSAKIAVSD